MNPDPVPVFDAFGLDLVPKGRSELIQFLPQCAFGYQAQRVGPRKQSGNGLEPAGAGDNDAEWPGSKLPS